MLFQKSSSDYTVPTTAAAAENGMIGIFLRWLNTVVFFLSFFLSCSAQAKSKPKMATVEVDESGGTFFLAVLLLSSSF